MKKDFFSRWMLLVLSAFILLSLFVEFIYKRWKGEAFVLDWGTITLAITFIAFGVIKIINEKRAKLENDQLHAENDKLHAEYQFLKVQINPHFLYNTLNFFYAKALPVSNELSNGILTLSEIMRYSLTSDEDEKGLVPLQREVEQINNFIHINRLRFGEKFSVEFNINGDTSSKKIVPLALITLVENAFKHGDSMNPNHPVKINLEVSQMNEMIFSVENLKKHGSKDKSHGIGLPNIRRQLDWVYKNEYTLALQETDDSYAVQLKINYKAEEVFFPINNFNNNLILILYIPLFMFLFIIFLIRINSPANWQNGHYHSPFSIFQKIMWLLSFSWFLIFFIKYIQLYRKGGGLAISKDELEFRNLLMVNLKIDWNEIAEIVSEPYGFGNLYYITFKDREVKKGYMKQLGWFQKFISQNAFYKKGMRFRSDVLKEDKDYVLSIINKKWEEHKAQQRTIEYL